MTDTTPNPAPINIGIRLVSMLLDHFFMSMLAMVFFLPTIFMGISEAMEMSNNQQVAPDLWGGIPGRILLFGFAVYFCKDCINGRSLAKRIFKLQVVHHQTGLAANPLRCFVRNIFCILWPIEVIAAIANPARRLGDRVAGTRVIAFDPTVEQPKVNIGQVALSLAVAYGFMMLVLWPFRNMASMAERDIEYVETSLNADSGRALEQLLTDSLGQYFTPNVLVYDTVPNQNLKYISVLLRLNENLLEDETDYQALNDQTTGLIYSVYPRTSFTGQIKYIFQAPGQMQSKSRHIGTRMQAMEEEE